MFTNSVVIVAFFPLDGVQKSSGQYAILKIQRAAFLSHSLNFFFLSLCLSLQPFLHRLEFSTSSSLSWRLRGSLILFVFFFFPFYSLHFPTQFSSFLLKTDSVFSSSSNSGYVILQCQTAEKNKQIRYLACFHLFIPMSHSALRETESSPEDNR